METIPKDKRNNTNTIICPKIETYGRYSNFTFLNYIFVVFC